MRQLDGVRRALRAHIIGAGVLWSFCSVPADAQYTLTASQVLDKSVVDHRDRGLWLYGVAEGWLWANELQKQQHGPGLYCQPGKLSLTSDQVYTILQQYVDEHPKSAADPAAYVLLSALRETFPCGPAGKS